jgi:hypothetical protein
MPVLALWSAVAIAVAVLFSHGRSCGMLLSLLP